MSYRIGRASYGVGDAERARAVADERREGYGCCGRAMVLGETERLLTLEIVRGFAVQEAGRLGRYLAEDRGLVLARLSEVETALASLWAAGRRADRARLASESVPPQDQQTDDACARLVRAGQADRERLKAEERMVAHIRKLNAEITERAKTALSHNLSSEPSPAEVAGVAAQLKNLAPKPPPHCCALGCESAAEWALYTGTTPDDYTHACTGHVGAMCDLVKATTVMRIGSEPEVESMADRARAADQLNAGKAR